MVANDTGSAPNGQLDDRRLVDAVLSGDHAAFRTLVDREAQPVIAICHRVVGDPIEAQDVAQEAFLQAYRALATFRGDGPFGAWLRRIAIRAAAARLAARRASAERQDVRLDAEVLDPRAANLHSGDDPEALALDAEQRVAILSAVDTLPTAQRDVVLLRFYGDMSLAEISKATGNPVGTIKSRLHRGVATLRDQLESTATS